MEPEELNYSFRYPKTVAGWQIFYPHDLPPDSSNGSAESVFKPGSGHENVLPSVISRNKDRRKEDGNKGPACGKRGRCDVSAGAVREQVVRTGAALRSSRESGAVEDNCRYSAVHCPHRQPLPVAGTCIRYRLGLLVSPDNRKRWRSRGAVPHPWYWLMPHANQSGELTTVGSRFVPPVPRRSIRSVMAAFMLKSSPSKRGWLNFEEINSGRICKYHCLRANRFPT